MVALCLHPVRNTVLLHSDVVMPVKCLWKTCTVCQYCIYNSAYLL